VELHFRNRPDQGKIEGSILNKSGVLLVIEATIFSPERGETARVQLSVPPYRAQSFGLTDGLTLRSGDQLTLKSSPYRDKAASIR
jgi:hypothetical protein